MGKRYSARSISRRLPNMEASSPYRHTGGTYPRLQVPWGGVPHHGRREAPRKRRKSPRTLAPARRRAFAPARKSGGTLCITYFRSEYEPRINISDPTGGGLVVTRSAPVNLGIVIGAGARRYTHIAKARRFAHHSSRAAKLIVAKSGDARPPHT